MIQISHSSFLSLSFSFFSLSPPFSYFIFLYLSLSVSLYLSSPTLSYSFSLTFFSRSTISFITIFKTRLKHNIHLPTQINMLTFLTHVSVRGRLLSIYLLIRLYINLLRSVYVKCLYYLSIYCGLCRLNVFTINLYIYLSIAVRVC